MARSPLTLAAAVTAAVPGAEAVRARPLTTHSDGRFDAAIVDLRDGDAVVIRVSLDDDAARELAAEAVALRALTAGARSMLPFAAPEFRGDAPLGDAHALVTTFLPGFQIEAGHIPAGRGAAEAIGQAIASVHALPASVVRGAGLPQRNAEEVRAEVAQVVDASSATGRVPARLTVRWREAVGDDALWRFESAVVLGGTEATAFLCDDDPEEGPRVTGLVHWHGLCVGDPAQDLAWVASARDAAESIHEAYAAASSHAQDGALAQRARLYAELEFARWLVHGEEIHRSDIVDDAAALLEALAEGLRNDDLRVIAERDGIDSALDAFTRMPETAAPRIDTSIHTDTYQPEELSLLAAEQPTAEHTDELEHTEVLSALTDDTAREAASATPSILPRTRPLAERSGAPGSVAASGAHAATVEAPAIEASSAAIALDAQATAPLDPLWTDESLATEDHAAAPSPVPQGELLARTPVDEDAEPDEAQRAARAALQRWKSSDSV